MTRRIDTTGWTSVELAEAIAQMAADLHDQVSAETIGIPSDAAQVAYDTATALHNAADFAVEGQKFFRDDSLMEVTE